MAARAAHLGLGAPPAAPVVAQPVLAMAGAPDDRNDAMARRRAMREARERAQE